MYSKALYLYCFGGIPSCNYIGSIDGEKAFNAIKEKFGELINSEHAYRHYNSRDKKYLFNETFLIMQNDCILEFDNSYCEIYHNGKQSEFINECTGLMKVFKERQRRKPLEMNLISRGRNGLEFKQLEVKRTKLDIGLFYEDDFKEVNDIICKRLNRSKDKGIVLLHGLPGTGKTTYLRYLIGKIKKRVLFLSPNVAGNLMDPEFIELLINAVKPRIVKLKSDPLLFEIRLLRKVGVMRLLLRHDAPAREGHE